MFTQFVRRLTAFTRRDREHERLVETVRMKKARKRLLANKVATAPLLLSVLKQTPPRAAGTDAVTSSAPSIGYDAVTPHVPASALQGDNMTSSRASLTDA